MEVNLSGQIGESENQSRLLLLPWEGLCLAVVLVEKVEVYFGLMNRSNPAWVKVAQIETCPAISQVSGAARAVCFSNRMRGGGGLAWSRGGAMGILESLQLNIAKGTTNPRY